MCTGLCTRLGGRADTGDPQRTGRERGRRVWGVGAEMRDVPQQLPEMVGGRFVDGEGGPGAGEQGTCRSRAGLARPGSVPASSSGP